MSRGASGWSAQARFEAFALLEQRDEREARQESSDVRPERDAAQLTAGKSGQSAQQLQ